MAYHHRDLPAVVLGHALEQIAESGPDGVSMRELARKAGVSHAAPLHHFHDRRGLLTAIAIEGFTALAEQLEEAMERSPDFVELGVAYVTFALEHRAHFQVMFRPDLLNTDDPALRDAGDRAKRPLDRGPTAAGEVAFADPLIDSAAAWSVMHGFASLWLTGNFSGDFDDPIAVAREIARWAVSR